MFKILKKEYLANNIWLMDIEAPRVAKHCQPGQFVIVKTDEKGGLSHADAASASAEFPVQSTRHHRFSAGGGGNSRKRPGGGGAGRPPVCGRAGKNAGGTKQVGNCPATAGQFLRNNKGVHSTFHIYC